MILKIEALFFGTFASSAFEAAAAIADLVLRFPSTGVGGSALSSSFLAVGIFPEAEAFLAD